MSFALIWIEIVIASVLWVAMFSACFSRLRRRWLGNLFMGMIVVIPVLLLGAFAVWAGMMKYLSKLEPDWFGYALSLWITALVGMEIVSLKGCRAKAGVLPRAATWRRGPLVVAWLAAVAVLGMTFWNIDLSILARANILALEAQTKYLADLPGVVSDSQNAAPLYDAAVARLHEDDELANTIQSSPIGRLDTFDPNEPAVKTFLARQARTIVLLRRAAAMPSCRFQQDLQVRGIGQYMPELNGERYMADALWMDGRYELVNGHVASAMSDVVAVKEMSRHFGQRPMLISALVAIGIDAMSAAFLKEVLPAVTRQSELADVNYDDTDSMRLATRRALEGEECFTLAEFRAMGGGSLAIGNRLISRNSMGPGGFPAMPPPLRDFVLSSELDAILDIEDGFQQAALDPYFKAKAQIDELRNAYSPNHPHWGMFNSILAPSLSRLLVNVAHAEAIDSCAQTAVAMTRYRLDHGSLPAHLNDLVPVYLDVVPTDPFDGKPLRLVIRDNQWIIYSVGPNGVDDGGIETKDQNQGDVIFPLAPNAIDLTTRRTTNP